uniref:CobW C-terminal domain-containing protein n=1 Tax=Zooxanthella nutricula TaxID=1333877 RepID=A0A7S2I7R9_9DINO
MGCGSRGSSPAAGAESPLSPVLRSKGVLLMDANPDVAYYWSHAGKSIQFSVFGPWPPEIPQEEGGFGPPKTELVFIGAGCNELAIRDLLDSCLVTDEELRLLDRLRGRSQ